MTRLMLALDRLVQRRGRVLLALWIVAVLAALPFFAQQSDRLSGGGFRVPDSGSKNVAEALEARFPEVQSSPLSAVLVPRPGASAADVRAARERLNRAVAADPDVDLGPPPERAATAGPTLVPLAIQGGDDASVDIARDLRTRLGGAAEEGPVRVHLVGYGALWSGLGEVSKEDLARAETIGFPIIALILLAVFGSLAAAALPLALGAVSVIVTGALIYALSLRLDMSIFVTNMASMIGIGVAVDYSLFVLARFREEVHAGRSLEAARARAMTTSGIAVLFSGATVIISLAGLWLVQNQAIRSMALGAILVVAVSMLASATLLPVLLRRRVVGKTPKPARGRFWRRWTGFVMRRPLLALLLSGGLLAAMALPVLDMKTGVGALDQFPEGAETVAGARAAAAVSGPGAASPVHVVVHGDAVDPRDLAARLERDPAVARVVPPRASGGDVLVTAIPRENGEAETTNALVRRLRAASPAGVDVGGGTAALQDLDALIADSMWKIIAFVLGLSFVVLTVLLRSIVLPLKAVVLNLLSVGAAYGVVVAVFQWGWLDGLFGYQSPGHVDWLTPPLVLAVVFGLSMDYEVFLLSRIRERYAATGDTRTAVAEGLATSARTISSAALIMVAVFAVFIGTGVDSIKQLGVGNAVAVGLDATLVRLVLLPAAMQLLGRWNWWLPFSGQHQLPSPQRVREAGQLAGD
jgi:RND superfamily putative drug exporter